MFKQQVRLAKSNYKNKVTKNGRKRNRVTVRRRHSDSVLHFVSDKSFERFANAAYKSKRGYAVRKNPFTGEKEMFVRGTTLKRGGAEWFQNLAEAPGLEHVGLGFAITGDVSRHIRGKYSKFLTSVAKRENVSVIYGHSRGGAVVNDMDVPGAEKVGLDAATILNPVSRIKNIRQDNMFDRVIGANSRKTVVVPLKGSIFSKKYHRVWRK